MVAIYYKAAENEVIATLVANVDFLNDNNCLADNIDALVTFSRESAESSDNNKYFCLIGMEDISPKAGETFSKDYWEYLISGLVAIRVTDNDDIDEEGKDVIVKLQGAFSGGSARGTNKILSWARVVNIAKPVNRTIADIPYLWIPFVIRVLDGGPPS